jgi:hypothetical protein
MVAGDPIVLRYSIQTDDGRTHSLRKYSITAHPRDFDIRNEHGKRLRSTTEIFPSRQARKEIVNLAPGESLTYDVNLRDWFDPLGRAGTGVPTLYEPGLYSVHMGLTVDVLKAQTENGDFCEVETESKVAFRVKDPGQKQREHWWVKFKRSEDKERIKLAMLLKETMQADWDPRLARFLDDDVDTVRMIGIAGVRRLRREEHAPRLVEILRNDQNSAVRSFAAHALGVLAVTKSVPALVKVVESRQDRSYRAAIRALGKIGDPRAIPVLENVAKEDPVEWVRDAARQAIQKIRKEQNTPAKEDGPASSETHGENTSVPKGTTPVRTAGAERSDEERRWRPVWLLVGIPAAVLSLCSITASFACKSKKQRLVCASGAAVFAGIAVLGIARSYRGAVPGDALSRDGSESEPVSSQGETSAEVGRKNSRGRSVRNRQTFTRPEDMGEDVSDFKEQKLVGMLANSEDRIERRKAARELGNRQMMGDLNGWSEHQQDTVDQVVGEFVANLAKRDNDLRSEAKHQIHRLWRLAVPELLERVGQPYAGSAEEAGECLSLMRNEDIVEKLVKKAMAAKTEREKKWWVFILSDFMKQRTSVIKGRGCIGNEESIRLVRKHILPWLEGVKKKDESESVQKHAGQAISQLRRLIEKPPTERKSAQKT